MEGAARKPGRLENAEWQTRLLRDHNAGLHKIAPVTGCIWCESEQSGEIQPQEPVFDVRTAPLEQVMAYVRSNRSKR